ncbi:hypothetical protein N7530_010512 [Penicillium desertorum]|uniref:Secreted protein n=1 Tax=Penicillium desertorum TaxID=1303715 RepID=A0A9X0BHW2_9EURO|nr:hypothetical protein N7530_010512 [Penicillium desertorum]
MSSPFVRVWLFLAATNLQRTFYSTKITRPQQVKSQKYQFTSQHTEYRFTQSRVTGPKNALDVE